MKHRKQKKHTNNLIRLISIELWYKSIFFSLTIVNVRIQYSLHVYLLVFFLTYFSFFLISTRKLRILLEDKPKLFLPDMLSEVISPRYAFHLISITRLSYWLGSRETAVLFGKNCCPQSNAESNSSVRGSTKTVVVREHNE